MIKTRTDIINLLIKINGYKKYLEIGVRKGGNFKTVRAEHKDGVDPNFPCNFRMTSDEFFKQNKFHYDLIFIDGLHLEKQVLRDLHNSFRFLRPCGSIVIHDCNPTDKSYQMEERHTKNWTGTVWKAWARYRMTASNLHMYVVDTDYGVGVIRRGQQRLFQAPAGFDPDDMTYEFLDKYRKELLNLIDPKEL